MFGYARDNSTYPLFLLHPVREHGDTFTLISVRGGEAFRLNATPEIRILPLEHFYDAFRATPMRNLRPEVISAFHLSPDKVTEDLRISRQTATALIRPDVRDLDLADEPEQSEVSPHGQPKQTPRDVRDQDDDVAMIFFFLLDAAWVRSRAERPSVSYTKVTSKVAWTSHNLQVTNKLKQQNCGSNKIRNKKGGDGKMKRMLEPSIKLIGEVHRMKMSGVRIQMQCRASNSLARRIEKVESKMCVCPPARRTRSTEVMKKGG